MFRRLFALVALATLAACSERPHLDFDDPTVRIRIVSDYAAGIETTRADVVVIDANGRVVARADRNILRNTPLLDGLEVASFDSVPAGRYTLRGSLKREDGTTLGEASLVVNVEGGSVHTLYILSSCEGVACEEGTACLQGTCVDPECSPADPTKCPPNFFCESDSDCTSEGDSCSAPRCVASVCTNAPIAGRCGETEYCAREEGCAPIEMPEMPPGPDPLCGTVCRIAEEPCRYGYYACSTTSDGNTVLVCTPFTTRPTGAPCGNGTVCNEAAECVEAADAGVDGGSGDGGTETSPDAGERFDAGIVMRDLGVPLDLAVPLDTSVPLDMRIVPDAAPNPCLPNPCGVGTCTPNDRAVIGYLCSCPEGYETNGSTCIDINECAVRTATCAVHTRCANTTGSYDCIPCDTGYDSPGGFTTECTDIDECALFLDDCTDLESCTNSPGSYDCTMPVGVGAGRDHSCVRFEDGTVKCWGDNGSQQLGRGHASSMGYDAPPSSTVDFGDGVRTASLVSTDYTSCGMLTDGTIGCWGVGHGVGSYYTLPDAQTVVVGHYFVCAIVLDGGVNCWGNNNKGQLGYGDTAPRGFSAANRVDLGDGHTAKRLAGGWEHMCAILDDDTVKCWGSNYFGQLGYGDSGDGTDRLSPPDEPIDLGPGRTAKEIAAGTIHTCAILDDDTVKCWGAGNALGYPGGATLTAPPVATVTMPGGRTPQSITSIGYHTCVLFDDDEVGLACWGSNNYGQIGDGTLLDRNPPVLVTPHPTERVISVAAGIWHTCVVLADQTVRCWGRNHEGQLGNGTFDDASLAPVSPLNMRGPRP